MIVTIEQLTEYPGALLGLDVGTKTIGVALSDPSQSLATPLQTIKRTKFTKDAAALFALMDSRDVTGLVIGLPRNMDGTEGPKVQSVKTFASQLGRKREVPILLWDERLSTAAAERSLVALDVSRAKRAAVIDSHAANFILQGALDGIARVKKGLQR